MPTNDAWLVANGWYRLDTTQYAKPSDGNTLVWDGVSVTPYGSYARAVYTEEAIPPRVRRFSKLKLWAALSVAGKWTAFKAFLDGAGLTDAWNLCQFVSDDYAGFADIKAQVANALGVTGEQIDAILAQAEDE